MIISEKRGTTITHVQHVAVVYLVQSVTCFLTYHAEHGNQSCASRYIGNNATRSLLDDAMLCTAHAAKWERAVQETRQLNSSQLDDSNVMSNKMDIATPTALHTGAQLRQQLQSAADDETIKSSYWPLKGALYDPNKLTPAPELPLDLPLSSPLLLLASP